jgi:cyclic pyranopterin phosphate synthase
VALTNETPNTAIPGIGASDRFDASSFVEPGSTPVAVSVRPHRAGLEGHPTTIGRSTDSAMPEAGPLIDRYGRVHNDLRISVTDRCNLRCVYCMSEEGMTFLPRAELLTFDEMTRVARVAHDLGVTSIRLTGGEPLVRRRLPELVSNIAAIGFDDLALTTNGMQLAAMAESLVTAGLTRVNVSCDSLRAERFESIRRRGDLATVLDAMSAAEAAGLTPLKVNVVLLRETNDDEILDFAAFARETGRIVRFIEFMPLDAQGEWERDRLVPGHEVYERINAQWPLEAVGDHAGPAPAERFGFTDGRGEIGLISSVTQPFCGTCNRLRLTADGSIRNCLFSDDEHTVRDALRGGGSDGEIAQILRQAVWAKFPGHAINEPEFLRPVRSMSMIGG